MRKVVVISSDAMVGEDLAYFSTLPNYRKYLMGGAQITQVSSIYPSVTFPAHTTMMTGAYPDKHGILSNMQLIPGSDPTPWIWERRFIQCGDIFQAAKAAGLTTAAVCWPVTAGNTAIDWHVADYWAQGEGDTNEAAFARAGANADVLAIIRKNEGLFKDHEREHPQRDEFCMACAADILRRFSPDLMLVHPANIDAARHDGGVFGEHLKPALNALDRWLGMIGQALEDNGTLSQTDLFIVSDHGQMDVRRNLSLNVLLAEHGFISVKDGHVTDWKAWCLSNGMSALIFLKDPQDQATYDSLYALLKELLAAEVYGISRIYTQEEAQREERLGGSFAFCLETDGYTAFGDGFIRPLISPLDNKDYRFGRATHGYLPSKGPQPLLLAKGPHIRPQTSLTGNHIVNEAPTYARILGFTLPDADGCAIAEILQDV